LPAAAPFATSALRFVCDPQTTPSLIHCVDRFAFLRRAPIWGLKTRRVRICTVRTLRESLLLRAGDCVVSQGTIKKLTDKGFGFIQGEQGDIFFHSSSVEGTSYESLREGQAVQYNEGMGPKGKRAENVKVVD
jgi:CspA family cold shock protein